MSPANNMLCYMQSTYNVKVMSLNLYFVRNREVRFPGRIFFYRTPMENLARILFVFVTRLGYKAMQINSLSI